MATINLSPLIMDINGKLDKVSMFKSNGKYVLRTSRTDLRTPSAAQLNVQYTYGYLWMIQDKLPYQFDENWKRYSDQIKLAPFSAFIKSNMQSELSTKHIIIAEDVGDSVPMKNFLASGTGTPGEVNLTWDGSPYLPTEDVWLFYRSGGGGQVNTFGFYSNLAQSGVKLLTGLSSGHNIIWIAVSMRNTFNVPSGSRLSQLITP